MDAALSRLRALRGDPVIPIELEVVGNRFDDSRKANFRSPEKEPGHLRVGDYVSMTITPPASGYLTLFNFGTDGKVGRALFPNRHVPQHRLVSGRKYSLPGILFPARLMKAPGFLEDGPTTTETGIMERVVALISENPVDLSPQDLHENLACSNEDDSGKVRENTASDLSVVRPDRRGLSNGGEWIWGLAEAEVC